MNLNPNECGVARTHARLPSDSVVFKGPLGCSWASLKALPDGCVSVLRVKAAARNLLPHDSLARRVILAEGDALPLEQTLAKFAVIDRLLVAELDPTGRCA